MTKSIERLTEPDVEIPDLVRDLVRANASMPLAALKDGYVADLNEGWLSVLGYALRDELIGRHVRELMTPQSWATCAVRLARRQAGETVSPKQLYDMLHRSGRVVKIEVTGGVWPTDLRIVFAAAVDVTQHIRRTEALEESERLYRMLAETVPAGVMFADRSGRNIYINEHIQRLTGYTADELAAGRWVIDPADTLAREHYRDSLANGTSGTDYETRLIRKDGSTVWVSISWSPVKDDEGGVVGVHTTFTDISARKRAEEALRESEASLRTFVNALTYPAFLIDTQGTLLMANKALARRFGKTVDEIIGTNSAYLVSEEVARMRSVWGMKVIETGKPVEFEDERAGAVFRHFLGPVFDEAGKVARLAWVSLDITDQRRAEEALREAEERFRLLAENSTDVIWEIDLEGRFTYISQAVRLWGYEPEEWVNRKVDEFLPDEEKGTFLERLARDLQDPSPRRYEVNMIRKDGSVGSCEVSVDVVVEDGRPIKVQGISRDVTERKRSEDDLRRAHADLEKAFRIQQEFLNNVTHEVRTPMTAVKGYVEMLLEGIAGPMTEEQDAMLQKVLMSSDSLLNLVSSLLEVARLKSGGVGLHPRACKPGEVAAKAVASVTPQAARKGIAVNVRLRGTDRVAVYDEQKVAIVITNLLSNAVKFTPRGKIDVTVTSRACGAEFVIVDTGVGIRQSDLGGIFDEFQQLDVPNKHKPSGFGLGLAIVASMVEMMGGTLVVSSRRGVGTAFTLLVPATSA